MNRRTLVLSTTLLAAAVFVGGSYAYKSAQAPEPNLPVGGDSLVRPHSPILGPVDAKVTIVEFLDPSCEACRAFYPFVKQVMAQYPKDVRVVVRYAAFHQGSDEAVKILEAARKQDKYEAVLEAVFRLQGQWAMHGAPSISRLEGIASSAGLDIGQARKDAASFEVSEVLRRDAADVKTLNIRATPTFYVNGKTLTNFSPEGLFELVASEVNATRSSP